jgi:signal transduction histidine kinase
MTRASRRYADLSIRLKLLAPFVVLMIVWGGFGSYVLARGAAGEARGRATAMLATSLNAARAQVSDAERALLETVRLATHTQGVAGAVRGRDTDALRRFLLPIVVNAQTLRLDVIDPDGGRVLALWMDGKRVRTARGGAMREAPVVRAMSGKTDARGDKWAGLSSDALLVAGPVQDGRGRIAGAIAVSRPLRDIIGTLNTDDGATTVLFTRAGAPLASTGPTTLPFEDASDGVRRSVRTGDGAYEALYGPLEARGVRIGTIATGLPSALALGSAAQTGKALAFLVGLVVIAAVGIGWWTARAITKPLGELMAATTSLERGELSARAQVDAKDEVGTLAVSFNRMASELQASHEELEAKVAARTAALEDANEQLARVSDAKSRFLASMSHELRTPLNAIIGFADMLGDPTFGPVRASETRELAGNILASGRHLLTLINDVLDLAKVEAGRIEVEPVPSDIGPIMGEVLAVVSPLAEQRKQHLSMTAGPQSRVLADPSRTRQILFNLVANAIKFTPTGGRITVGVSESAGEVVVSVRDTGPGLTPKEAQQIFEPFERGKAKRSTEGAGLGLALAKHLVELQGGRIWADSKPGHGATFSFTIPLAPQMNKVVAHAKSA